MNRNNTMRLTSLETALDEQILELKKSQQEASKAEDTIIALTELLDTIGYDLEEYLEGKVAFLSESGFAGALLAQSSENMKLVSILKKILQLRASGWEITRKGGDNNVS